MDDKGADEDVDAEDDDADGDDQHGEVVHGETIVEGVQDMGARCERDISFAKKKKLIKNNQHYNTGLVFPCNEFEC